MKESFLDMRGLIRSYSGVHAIHECLHKIKTVNIITWSRERLQISTTKWEAWTVDFWEKKNQFSLKMWFLIDDASVNVPIHLSIWSSQIILSGNKNTTKLWFAEVEWIWEELGGWAGSGYYQYVLCRLDFATESWETRISSEELPHQIGLWICQWSIS